MEAALLTDPENTELLKLKQDLEEVIELTRDLIKSPLDDQKKSAYVEPDASRHRNSYNQSSAAATSSASASSHAAGGASANPDADSDADGADDDDYDDVEAALLAAEKSVGASKAWKVGDKCQAKWTEDGQFYDATIEGIHGEHGEVMVVFDAYQNRSTTTLRELKERVVRNEVFPSTK